MVRMVRWWLGLLGIGIALASCSPTGNAIQQLRQGSTEERIRAARKLGEAGGDEVVTALVAALSDPVPEVQVAVAESLGKLISRAQGDLWTDLHEGAVAAVGDANTLVHGLSGVIPDALVGLTLEFTSGPRQGERYQVSANNAAELTVAEAVDFTEKGRDVTGSAFRLGHPVSETLIAALAGAQWKDEAIRAYEETIDTGAPTADIHLTLARLYGERGQKTKALEHLDEALSMAENADMFVNVAREFSKLGERDRALQSLGQVLDFSEETPNGYAYIDAAREYVTLGESAPARKLLDRAKKMASAQHYLYSSMAEVYEMLGDKKEAEAARAKAASAQPGGGMSFPGGTFQVQ